MSTVKSKKLQVGTDATASNNFTIYQPDTPDGTLRIGVGNADSPTEVGRFTNAGYIPATAPAFSAYLSGSNQSILNGTFTKIQCQSKDFDTNTNYDAVTNYRFTPTVAGYYQVSGSISFQGSSALTRFLASVYKNGSEYIRFTDIAGTSVAYSSQGSCLVYCNGSTDYLELYCYSTGTGIIAAFGRNKTNFQGFLARAA